MAGSASRNNHLTTFRFEYVPPPTNTRSFRAAQVWACASQPFRAVCGSILARKGRTRIGGLAAVRVSFFSNSCPTKSADTSDWGDARTSSKALESSSEMERTTSTSGCPYNTRSASRTFFQ